MAVAARTGYAFKEWAVVVDALLDGRQVVTLRKGGISEEGGRFAPDEERFWLFPTYEHQSADVLAETERGRHARVLDVPRPAGEVRIHGFAECPDVGVVPTEEAARRLAPETIWTEDALAARFRMMPGRPLWAMILLVRRLSSPVSVPIREAYGGCKSWVPLDDAALAALPDPAGLSPVLDASTFAARRVSIHSLLGA